MPSDRDKDYTAGLEEIARRGIVVHTAKSDSVTREEWDGRTHGPTRVVLHRIPDEEVAAEVERMKRERHPLMVLLEVGGAGRAHPHPADGPAYRAPTFTLAAPRERAWWERALVAVGRHVHALRWLPAYRRAVGGRWAKIARIEYVRPVDSVLPVFAGATARDWQHVERCPAEWTGIAMVELSKMLADPREFAMRLNLTREQHITRCTCEVYP